MPTLRIFTNDPRKYQGGVFVGRRGKRGKLSQNSSRVEPVNSFFTNQAHYVNKDGKGWMVVPGVPVQEQVMNTYLLPAEEIQKSLNDWNGTPLSIRHAQENGGSVQVDNPDVPIIGQFQNATWDKEGKRMLGEYWIDISEAMKYPDGITIMNAIQQGNMVETSTAYWADEEWKSGTFKNKSYKSIHRNPKRDHIAIFPDNQLGACSVQDGCGLNRNMKQNGSCPCVHQNMTGSLEGKGKALWEKVYNSSKKSGDDEETAAKKAWAAVKNAGWHKKGDQWMKKNNYDGEPYPEYQKGHLPTSMLIGYAFNKGSRMKEQMDLARKRMEEEGLTKPVWVQCVDNSYKILDGNHRVHLADELGIEQVPVHVVNSQLMELDPEVIYRKWLHEQDQEYLQ